MAAGPYIAARLSMNVEARIQLTTACFALRGVLKNGVAAVIFDHAPLLDFVEGAEAAETDQVIIQATVADARRRDSA
jgi:hypothetical protein